VTRPGPAHYRFNEARPVSMSEGGSTAMAETRGGAGAARRCEGAGRSGGKKLQV
jgi:hypothetical protein